MEAPVLARWTVNQLVRHGQKGAPLMSMVARETAMVTEHGILVPLGRFAQQVGVDDALRRVPFEMKTVIHSPGEKLAELLCHICSGGMYIKELEQRAHPLVRDQAV